MSAKVARMVLVGHDPADGRSVRRGSAVTDLMSETDGPSGRDRVLHADDATMPVELVLLARLTVHPHCVVEGMLTYCQCTTCRRVERALAETAMAMREVTVGVANLARTVHERDAADARDRALIHHWREHAAIERADACAARPMSPALRSVRNHRGQVYDACADQLAAIRAVPGSASGLPVAARSAPSVMTPVSSAQRRAPART